MARLDTAMQKTVGEMLKGSVDVTVRNLPAFASSSEIIKCLTEIKNQVSKNKGKDITVITSVR